MRRSSCIAGRMSASRLFAVDSLGLAHQFAASAPSVHLLFTHFRGSVNRGLLVCGRPWDNPAARTPVNDF